MYFIDGFYEVFFRAILLPEIPFNPLVRPWYCFVYLSQSLVEDIAEMPQGIVNINDCLFHVLFIFSIPADLPHEASYVLKRGVRDSISKSRKKIICLGDMMLLIDEFQRDRYAEAIFF